MVGVSMKTRSIVLLEANTAVLSQLKDAFSMAEDYKQQNITLEGRRKLSITGVKEVENFDDNGIVLVTDLGPEEEIKEE